MQWNDDKYQVQYMKVRVAFRGTFPPQEAKSSAFIEITQPPQARVKMPEEASQMTGYCTLQYTKRIFYQRETKDLDIWRH